MIDTNDKRVTIKDIASQVGVSTTTVTKALRGLPPISEETTTKIMETAQKMGYKPNRSAQVLVRGNIRIAAVYMIDSVEYITYMEKGIRAALAELSDYNIHFETLPVPNIFASDIMKNTLEDLRKRDIDGLIFAPQLRQPDYRGLIEQYVADGIPVCCITQEMKGIQIPVIQSDWYTIGKLAAQVFNLAMPRESHIAIITTNKDFDAHILSRKGFTDIIDHEKITDISVYENQDNREITYLITKEIIQQRPDINGIYVTSYNSVRVCRCIEDHGMTGKITVIGQDLYPELIECMDKQQLLATIFPDQYQIGYQAVKQIVDHIFGTGELKNTTIVPQLIFPANLDNYRSFCSE